MLESEQAPGGRGIMSVVKVAGGRAYPRYLIYHNYLARLLHGVSWFFLFFPITRSHTHGYLFVTYSQLTAHYYDDDQTKPNQNPST